jgi:hypothetical protein
MANIILTPTVLLRGVLMNLGGRLNVARNMTKEYQKQFGGKGVKPGATIQVPKPQRFEGTRNTKFTPESLKNTSTPVTVDKRANVHFEWSSVEKTLSIIDAQQKYFKPASITIAHMVNADAAEYAFLNSFNTVGTPGVVPGAGSATVPELLDVYMKAGDKLIEQGLPEGEQLNCIISRRMSSVFVGRVSSLFTPTEVIGKQYKTGWVDPTGLGYNWYKDQGLYVHTSGTLADASNNTVVNGANQVSGDGNNSTGSLIIDGLDASATIKAGDWFTIANVYSTHPQYHTSTGQLAQFRVLADVTADGSGNATLSIYPAITASGQYQNVDSVPANDAAVLFDEAAVGNVDAYGSTVSRAGLLLHKNAFAFCSVPLEGPEDGMGAILRQETDPDTGITIRFTRSWDGDEEREITRLDTLYGFGRLYGELCSTILSAS